MLENYKSVTSLAELEKRLPSKQLYIGSNPIGCKNVNFKIKNFYLTKI